MEEFLHARNPIQLMQAGSNQQDQGYSHLNLI